MDVAEIEMWRDGGTITFAIAGSSLAGRYRLRTPFAGEPRPLFQDDVQLAVGGPEEAAVLAGLREWFSAVATRESDQALARLDGMHEWRNLPADLARAVPLHRIRAIIRCLETRAGQ